MAVVVDLVLHLGLALLVLLGAVQLGVEALESVLQELLRVVLLEPEKLGRKLSHFPFERARVAHLQGLESVMGLV